MEYVDGGLQLIHIPNGRITEKEGVNHYQYHLADHLGNIVVLFEDVNEDGKISIEEDPGNPDSEIIQRNHYYSFGMRVDAPHFALSADPRGDYLYNGKELQEELDLNWLAYGFRMYDPAIGRFPSVDPIADRFPHVNPFNYAENRPIDGKDLWGLQYMRFDADLDPGLNSINATKEERKYYNQTVLKATVGGASAIGLTYVALEGIAWVAVNPATTLEGVRNLGMAMAEGLTEQQIAGAALAAKVGNEVIGLAPGYSNFFQRIIWGQWTGKAIIPTIKNGKILLKGNAANGVADFIISEKGELIIGSGHHFMSGQSKSVIAAGEVFVEDGVLKTVSNQSGHYQPSGKMLNKFLDYFKNLGVDVSKATTTTEKIQ
jgi:RHS repeat-associated protein